MMTVLRLYSRCRRWNVLPESGSLIDQSEALMSLFEAIDQKVDEMKAVREQEQRSEMIHHENMRKMGRHA